jgi:hypothetical protein
MGGEREGGREDEDEEVSRKRKEWNSGTPPSLPPSLPASPLKLRVILHHQLFHEAQDLLHNKHC